MDKYCNFDDLRLFESEGVDYCVSIEKRFGSNITIIAPHGGKIEPGTSELAEAIAGEDLNFALFKGMKKSGNSVLHITSTNFDEPRCTALVKSSEKVIAIHGEKSAKIAVYIGGLDSELRNALQNSLTRHGFRVLPHTSLQGLMPNNICNQGLRNIGVQLEITKGLRQTFFTSLSAKGRKTTTRAFNEFIIAVREGLFAVSIV